MCCVIRFLTRLRASSPLTRENHQRCVQAAELMMAVKMESTEAPPQT